MKHENFGKKRCTAIVLAAGQGSRMGTKVQKQYLEIEGKPVLYYYLAVFESSNIIDDIILVVGEGQIEYCKKEIVEKYRFSKVVEIVTGGKERYESVYCALLIMDKIGKKDEGENGYVFIHDGARPFVNEEIIERTYHAVMEHQACVAGMPTKDTIKVVGQDGFAKETPDRNTLWLIQTPQVFESALIKKAYFRLMEEKNIQVTDDAMVVEKILGVPVKLVEGSYENIKITTPEDLPVAEIFVKQRQKKAL